MVMKITQVAPTLFDDSPSSLIIIDHHQDDHDDHDDEGDGDDHDGQDDEANQYDDDDQGDQDEQFNEDIKHLFFFHLSRSNSHDDEDRRDGQHCSW